MKNITTPRTLADCTFTTGYSESQPFPPRRSLADWCYAAVGALSFAAIGVLLAWRG